jgi:hypothetical protein
MATGDAPIKVDPATVQILKAPAMANPGIYPKPIPFGGMGKPVNQNGSPITSPSPSRSPRAKRWFCSLETPGQALPAT